MTTVFSAEDAVGDMQPVKDGKKSLFWLGAGFSRALTPKAPLMTDFFAGFDGDKYPHLAKYLAGRCGAVEDLNVESVLFAVEQSENSPLPPRDRAELMCGQDPKKIKTELEKFCLERLCYNIDDSGRWAVSVLQIATELTTVVTTNYDVLAERILSHRHGVKHCVRDATCHHCNMRAILEDKCVCSGADQSSPGPKHAALLKLHGSIAWRTCTNAACGITECLKSTCDCSPIVNPKCECCGEEANPVIVLPSASKSYARYPHMVRMWSLANDALSDAETITLFGFSFPATDVLIQEMFRSKLARSRKLRELFIIDISPKDVWDRMERFMPVGLDLSVRLLPVPRDRSTPKWIGEETAATTQPRLRLQARNRARSALIR